MRIATPLLLAGLLLASCGDDGEVAVTAGGDDETGVTTPTGEPARSSSTTSTSTTSSTTTTTVPVPDPTPTTTAPPARPPAPEPEPEPGRNLGRNGPFEPQGELWPRDGHEPSDPHQRLWLQGRDLDGWVVRVEVDWMDGSPVEVHEWPLDACGPAEGDLSDDPFPSGSPGVQRVAVEHYYPADQTSFVTRLTVTSVSCDGDEPQTATTELHGGITPG
jgi:hypothetical protein